MDKVETLETELGNAKAPSRKQKQGVQWIHCHFRLSNYTRKDIEKFVRSNRDEVPVLGFQEEDGRPSNPGGTPHLQGFCSFKKKQRPIQYWSAILGHSRTKWMKRKGSLMHNVEYCTAPEKRIPEGFVYYRGPPRPRPLVKMTYEHLTDDQKAIVDKYKEFEDPLFGRDIHWYWEPRGEWGKTKTQKYMLHNMNATMVGGKKGDMFYALSELKHATGEVPPIVIINLVKDTDMRYVSYAGMESIKDGVFFSKKFKSGMCLFNSPHLLVFANEPPDMSRWTKGTSKHRCLVFPLTDEAKESTDWALD